MGKRAHTTKESRARPWLDDLRPVPEGRVWTNTVEESILLMVAGNAAEPSLDHDLREGIDEGYQLVPWVVEMLALGSDETTIRQRCRTVEANISDLLDNGRGAR